MLRLCGLPRAGGEDVVAGAVAATVDFVLRYDAGQAAACGFDADEFVTENYKIFRNCSRGKGSTVCSVEQGELRVTK